MSHGGGTASAASVPNVGADGNLDGDGVVYTALDGDIEYLMIDGVAYVGILKIPALELELPINATCTMPALKLTPCRYSGDLKNNSLVIAAHRYNRFFARINRLARGEVIIFVAPDGTERRYEVARTETVAPTDVDYVKNSDYDLTLFTCTYGGRARTVVRCVSLPPTADYLFVT
jgi:sortase A